MPGADYSCEEGKTDYDVEPLLCNFTVNTGKLYKKKGEQRSHYKLPFPYDQKMCYKSPVKLVYLHVLRFEEGKEIENSKAKKTNKKDDGDARPLSPLDHRHDHIEYKHQYDNDYRNLYYERLLEKLPAVMPSEEIADYGSCAAYKKEPELQQRKLDAVYLTFDLFRKQIIRRAHKTENKPYYQQIDVYHTCYVKGDSREKHIRPYVLSTYSKAEDYLAGEKQHSGNKERIGYAL